MQGPRLRSLLFLPLFVPAILVSAQSNPVPADDQAPAVITLPSPTPPPADSQTPNATSPIPANAPRMSRQTRIEIIRDFEAQLMYARTFFPMGTKGIKLRDGVTSPNGEELKQALALWGPAVKPGDPAHISFVQIKNDHIHFDINGGPIHRKKWYEHIQVSGANDTPVQLGPENSAANPHGTYLDVYFDKYVPEMTAQQLRDVLYPVLDFNAKSKEEAYLDTVPPKAKAAIQAHNVLVGMNAEMVLHAKGRPPKKVREKDGDTEYEEWIYGEPPNDVDFIRIVGDEVVRVEIMKVGGVKTVRTEKEIILDRSDKDKDTEAKQEERPAKAPSLRRPGEDQEETPKPADGVSPVPIAPSPDPQSPSGNPSGPGDIVASKH